MAFFGRSAPPPTRLEELKRALQKEPGSRQFLALAEELRKEGEFGEAIRALENGLRYHPTYVAAQVSLGRVLRESGRPDDALKAFLNALRLDGENLVAIKQAALLYLEKGEQVEAVKKLKRYRGLNPGDKEVAEEIERLDLELGSTSRLRSSSIPAGLPLPQRDPSTRPFITPPPAPQAPEEMRIQAEPFPVYSVEPPREPSVAGEPDRSPAGLEPAYASLTKVVVREDDRASRPPVAEPDVFLFEAEVEPVRQGEPSPAPSDPFAGEVERSVEDEDRTLPGRPIGLPVSGTAPEAPSGSAGTGEAPAKERRGERRGELFSETLADLYLSQGLRLEARNAFETMACTEEDPGRAAAFRARARAIAEEDAAAAATAGAGDPRVRRLVAYLGLVGRPEPGPGDLNEIVDELVRSGSGIETAIVMESGGVPVVMAGPFGQAEELLSAELGAFWKNLKRGSDDVEAGKPSAVSLVADAGSAVVSGIGDGYALVLRIAAGVSLGRIRYQAARAVCRLRPLLV